jgi:hypothetical protein
MGLPAFTNRPIKLNLRPLTKVLVAFISILFVAIMAFADTCESQAAAKKMVSSAKKIFIKKCMENNRT